MAEIERILERAAELNIAGIRRHIFLCADATEPKCCARETSLAANFVGVDDDEPGKRQAAGKRQHKPDRPVVILSGLRPQTRHRHFGLASGRAFTYRAAAPVSSEPTQ